MLRVNCWLEANLPVRRQNGKAKHMRTDVQIDRKQVHCPNASGIGYGKYKAQFGDIVIASADGHVTIGRVAGRIAYATAIGEDRGPIRDWLVVVALSSNLTFPMERWINPADVIEVYDPQNIDGANPATFLAFFFGAQFKAHSVESLREWANNGFGAAIAQAEGKAI